MCWKSIEIAYKNSLNNLKLGEVDYILHDPRKWFVQNAYSELKALADKDNMLNVEFQYSYTSDVYFIKVTKLNNSTNILKEI